MIFIFNWFRIISQGLIYLFPLLYRSLLWQPSSFRLFHLSWWFNFLGTQMPCCILFMFLYTYVPYSLLSLHMTFFKVLLIWWFARFFWLVPYHLRYFWRWRRFENISFRRLTFSEFLFDRPLSVVFHLHVHQLANLVLKILNDFLLSRYLFLLLNDKLLFFRRYHFSAKTLLLMMKLWSFPWMKLLWLSEVRNLWADLIFSRDYRHAHIVFDVRKIHGLIICFQKYRQRLSLRVWNVRYNSSAAVLIVPSLSMIIFIRCRG